MVYATLMANADTLRRKYESFALNQIRLPTGIGTTDLDRLEPLVGDKRAVQRGETVFRQGDASRALFVVRSGALKTSVTDPAGGEQVLGFHLPGEIVGIGGLGKDFYLGTAEALENSNVWTLPHTQLRPVLDESPALHQQLSQIIGRWTDANLEHLIIMSKAHARVRLAMFLRSFSSRYKRLSRDPLNLTLPMSRRELGSYLGLTLETVSRELGHLQTRGVISVDRKEIVVLLPELLAEICADGLSAVR